MIWSRVSTCGFRMWRCACHHALKLHVCYRGTTYWVIIAMLPQCMKFDVILFFHHSYQTVQKSSKHSVETNTLDQCQASICKFACASVVDCASEQLPVDLCGIHLVVLGFESLVIVFPKCDEIIYCVYSAYSMLITQTHQLFPIS